MRYFVIEGSIDNMCGTDFEYLQSFENNMTDEELDRFAADIAVENLQAYGYEDEDEEDGIEVAVQSSWREISKEEYEKMLEEGCAECV